jgi:hypothetical protein
LGAAPRVWNPLRHGFFAGLYRKGDLVVLAYRGTDDWQVDSIDDAVIAFGWISNQMGQAWNALRASQNTQHTNPTYKLCLTGHSLGGGLAAVGAARADLPAVTFNAPGTKRSFEAHYHRYFSGSPYFAPMLELTKPHEVNDGRILNIRARFDVVSVGTGPSLGVTDSINVHCAGPSGRLVRGPIQAGIDGFVHSYAERLTPVFTLDYSFASGVSNYVICQQQMSRMLSEVSQFDKYKQDLGW